MQVPTWSKGNTAGSEIRQKEYPIEQMVSNHICAMPFLWLRIDDAPGPFSDRGVIERNSIALLSNYKKQDKIDPSSKVWLGNYSVNEKIRLSGLWNVEHVDENYNPDFLKILEKYVEEM
ncbi:hypothetical protein MBGDF03_00941 [Thermoplasmatales archaeon SCGC AB-540-F20]|nr:hypothetical protein MBGDF03_00941 [Thermoplasmatales archaeon SCGC AB-540-F20]